MDFRFRGGLIFFLWTTVRCGGLSVDEKIGCVIASGNEIILKVVVV